MVPVAAGAMKLVVPGAALICEIVPRLPFSVRLVSPWIVMELPVADDVIVPLLVNVLAPFRFMVIALLADTVVPAATVVVPVPEVVVVIGPPLKATVPPPLNVKLLLVGSVMV